MGTRLEVVDATFKKIETIVNEAVPEAENTVTFLGGSTWRARGSNAGSMRIALKPIKDRDRSSEEIAAALRKKLAAIPGASIRTRAGQGLFILRIGTGGDRPRSGGSSRS